MRSATRVGFWTSPQTYEPRRLCTGCITFTHGASGPALTVCIVINNNGSGETRGQPTARNYIMSQASRLREALNAGGPLPASKDKGPPVADGVLSVTPDTPEAVDWKSRQSPIDVVCASSPYLDDHEDGMLQLEWGSVQPMLQKQRGGCATHHAASRIWCPTGLYLMHHHCLVSAAYSLHITTESA